VAAAAITCGAAVDDLARFIAIHPTYAELVVEALEDWRGLATHKP
jgi:pyruvate/2-oxoglutarate dehydrogenase complex dihydrolipoamide dehydrogenase (E3) component